MADPAEPVVITLTGNDLREIGRIAKRGIVIGVSIIFGPFAILAIAMVALRMMH